MSKAPHGSINVKGTTRVGKAGFFATVPFNYEARHKLSLF
jgi:hypothetical protein